MSVAGEWEPYTYNDALGYGSGDPSLIGYNVEATDGSIGKIDEASNKVGASYLVVDTGPWIFGKKVLLPAGVVDRIDPQEEKVYVSVTKDQIKDSPRFDNEAFDAADPGYRGEVGTYYGDSRLGLP